jgi:predicted ribosome quality control (RQC) complex YloA/Tae2 family protein
MKIELCSFSNIAIPIEYRIGSNAQDNFEVIDSGGPKDIWFHAHNNSSCHVLVILPDISLNKKQLQTIIKKGCDLCKQNTSSLRNDKNKIEFIYTEVRNLIKSDVVGMVYSSNMKCVSR